MVRRFWWVLPVIVSALAAAWLALADHPYPLVCRTALYPADPAPPAFPGATWHRVADPAAHGWDPAALERAHAAAHRARLAAVMIVEGGRLISASGCTRTRWPVASVRKSLMNAVLGRDVARGVLSPGTTLAELGLDDTPPLRAVERETDLHRLMTSSTGICRPAAAGATCTPVEAASRATPFLYNNWDFNMLWSVHAAVSSRDAFTVFAQDIAGPIGIRFDPARDGRLERIAASPHPACPMDPSAADMARFGLLYLRGGDWDGHRILPPGWVAESTRAQVSTGPGPGAPHHGYLWWIHAADNPYGLPPGTFAAEGNGLQAILVIPAWDAVIVIRGHVPRLLLPGRPDAADLAAVFAAYVAARKS